MFFYYMVYAVRRLVDRRFLIDLRFLRMPPFCRGGGGGILQIVWISALLHVGSDNNLGSLLDIISGSLLSSLITYKSFSFVHFSSGGNLTCGLSIPL